jgi:hypothetical protein
VNNDAPSMSTRTRGSSPTSASASFNPAHLPPTSFYRTRSTATDITPAARRGRSLDKNNNSSGKRQSDPDEDEHIHKLDNPWYKSVPPNPKKKKFNWETMGKKGEAFLKKYYTQ